MLFKHCSHYILFTDTANKSIYFIAVIVRFSIKLRNSELRNSLTLAFFKISFRLRTHIFHYYIRFRNAVTARTILNIINSFTFYYLNATFFVN